ncbi:MAG: hypothetical protein ACR2FG_14850, partial [Marmoricola sp.]
MATRRRPKPDPSAKPDAYCTLLERVQGDVSSFDFRSLSQAQFTDLRDKVQQLADTADGQIQTLSTDPGIASASADIQSDARQRCNVTLGGSG